MNYDIEILDNFKGIKDPESGLPCFFIETIRVRSSRKDYRFQGYLDETDIKYEVAQDLTDYIMKHLHIHKEDVKHLGTGNSYICSLGAEIITKPKEKDLYEQRIKQLKDQLHTCKNLVENYQNEKLLDMFKRWWKT